MFNRRSRFAMLGCLLFAVPAIALINPRFTVVELVKTSPQIVLLRVKTQDKGTLNAEVVESLKGAAFAPKGFQILTDKPVAGDVNSAVLVMSRRDADESTDDARTAAILIGTTWHNVKITKDSWQLIPDARDLTSVWGGNATMLAEAIRYAQSDTQATFPVASRISFRSDLSIGTLKGTAHGIYRLDLGGKVGEVVLVCADGGDQLFKWSGKAFADITAESKITTSSRFVTAGDFDGDQFLDLVVSDGKTLTLLNQTSAGTFDARPLTTDAKEILSLHTVNLGKKNPGIVIGTPAGPVFYSGESATSFAAASFTPPADAKSLGAPGPCFPVDLNRDGKVEILQIYGNGMITYTHEGAAVTSRVDLPTPGRILCADVDTDGKPDVFVAGKGGVALLTQAANNIWVNASGITGELNYHGNANSPEISDASLVDINNDGRQGIALFYHKRAPLTFFNRGFACFGMARELDVVAAAKSAEGSEDTMDPFAAATTKSKMLGADALQRGQSAGLMTDINNDGTQDMVSVDGRNRIWALVTKGDLPKWHSLTMISPADSQGPLTVAVEERKRARGIYIVRPGMPVTINRTNGEELTLRWHNARGEPQKKTIAPNAGTRINLLPD